MWNAEGEVQVSLKGYRTFLANGIIVVAAAASIFGIVIPQDDQTALIAGIIAAVNIVLRFYTTGPWGKTPPA